MSKPRVIALYLPQYYPFKENDEWWGKGFTEWTNVGKSKPLFRGHYQPRVPADLGYYDLRVPEIREQQAELAREAGIEGFCYWHYWFNGKQLLNRVFDEVLESGHPDFPFCLGWANHSWYAKTWAKDIPDKLLIEQTYPGIEDARNHFNYLLKAFKDERYIKVDGKPFLFIYHALGIPDEYIKWFRQWTIEAGFPGLYIAGNLLNLRYKKEDALRKGFDAVIYPRLNSTSNKTLERMGTLGEFLFRLNNKIRGIIFNRPSSTYDFRKYYHQLITEEEKLTDVIPSLVSGFDHSPRSGRHGLIYTHVTPDAFYNHAKDAINAVKNKPHAQSIILLRSWNEWGEGNYMEPDLKYGKGFITALRRACDEL